MRVLKVIAKLTPETYSSPPVAVPMSDHAHLLGFISFRSGTAAADNNHQLAGLSAW